MDTKIVSCYQEFVYTLLNILMFICLHNHVRMDNYTLLFHLIQLLLLTDHVIPLVSEGYYDHDELNKDICIATGNALIAKVRADLDTLQLEVAPLCSAEIKCLFLRCVTHLNFVYTV